MTIEKPHFAIENTPDLVAHLRRLLAQVPAGSVTTYGALAKALGNVVASRWIAHFLLHDARASSLPAQRVVRIDGSLGSAAAAAENRRRAALLREEGVAVHGDKVDLAKFGVENFRGPRPLEALRQLQEEIPRQSSLAPLKRPPRLVAGLDVSYIGEHEGIGGYALVDYSTGELVWSTTAHCQVPFPYITSYLSFRELPVLIQLLAAAEAAGHHADLHMIDGAGIMHPRRAGVATHFGVVAGVATIGVTKKLLAGRFDDQLMREGEPRDVVDGDDLLGAAIRPRGTSKRMIYVSPGHQMDVAGAVEVVRKLLRGEKLPRPIYWADRLSRQVAAKA